MGEEEEMGEEETGLARLTSHWGRRKLRSSTES
jgi:hypothetical protein